MNASAALARSITWGASKQSYYTARLMVDRGLVDDCYRAYAYFRWADDVIDVESRTSDERVSFIQRQRDLIERLYQDEPPGDLTPEEQMVADLIRHDRGDGKLGSYVQKFLDIIEFDAYRKGRPISQDELTWYSDCLGQSVTDGIQYFVGHGHPYPTDENHYLAATAAHITHMLRDMVEDVAEGFINVPREYLEAHGISASDWHSPALRAWVHERVELARKYFREGKRYLDELQVLRCKIVAHWYCARFEGVLDAIERDDYVLRPRYDERRKLSAWFKFARLGVSVALRHVAGKIFSNKESKRGKADHNRRSHGERAYQRNDAPFACDAPGNCRDSSPLPRGGC
jgi:phytoene/squalene synthetase